VKALLDKKLWKKNSLIAGVDEAGRGPLAGPVVAAAVILPRNFYHPEIDDSKKLSVRKRTFLYEHITKNAIAYAFGIIDHNVIDDINILNATKNAMTNAIVELRPNPDVVLIDALSLDTLSCKQIALIHGDTLSISIAAASILAKVKRDQIMEQYHVQYPVYGFNHHKGYPTKYHREQLKVHGPCAIHRRSFRLIK
jgi:ribonuclease HII